MMTDTPWQRQMYLWLCNHLISREKIKTLDLYFHKTYQAQTWHSRFFIRSYDIKWQIRNVLYSLPQNIQKSTPQRFSASVSCLTIRRCQLQIVKIMELYECWYTGKKQNIFSKYRMIFLNKESDLVVKKSCINLLFNKICLSNSK